MSFFAPLSKGIVSKDFGLQALYLLLLRPTLTSECSKVASGLVVLHRECSAISAQPVVQQDVLAMGILQGCISIAQRFVYALEVEDVSVCM